MGNHLRDATARKPGKATQVQKRRNRYGFREEPNCIVTFRDGRSAGAWLCSQVLPAPAGTTTVSRAEVLTAWQVGLPAPARGGVPGPSAHARGGSAARRPP